MDHEAERSSQLTAEDIGPTPSAPAQAKKPRFHIPSLDGIRAMSILLVFVAHAGLGHLVPGGFGVTVFFFLSGYLITTLMRMEDAKSGTVSLKGFYIRRIYRIFPPFYVSFALAIAFAMLGGFPGELELKPVLMQLFYLGNVQQITHPEGTVPGSGILWSLAIEEHFYFAFPLIYLAIRRRMSGRQQAYFLLSLCAATLVWRCVLVYGFDASESRTYHGTDTRLDAILFGCVLAVFGNPMLDGPSTLPRWVNKAAVPAAIAVLLFALVYRDPKFRESFRYTLQGLALFPIFIAAIRAPEHPLFAILNQRWIRYIGHISYSLYLVHHTVIYASREHMPDSHPLLQGAVALAASLAIASIFHHWVEKPFVRLRKR